MADKGFVISFSDVTAKRASARTLLDISKPDAGKTVFEVQPLHLSEVFTPFTMSSCHWPGKRGPTCGLSKQI
ncbi:hypothetical protein MACH17_43400 [Phaeobacter inhibens]|nr:hypothetical protein MACH17_43400 [Phaeobacter inhibens]